MEPIPDVSWTAPAEVRLWVALDVHKHSIVAVTRFSGRGGRDGPGRITRTSSWQRRHRAITVHDQEKTATDDLTHAKPFRI
jgi:hypothetical protein